MEYSIKPKSLGERRIIHYPQKRIIGLYVKSMNLEIFLIALFAVSLFTGLFTEAIKKWLDERGKTYFSNALAGYVAVALSVVVSAGYVILTESALNAKMAVYLIALMVLSWLSSMIGYDKVIQTIQQIAGLKK